MKRLKLRVSNLLKVSVLALIFSVFLQASLASANGAIELNQDNFYSTIDADTSGEDGSIGGNYKLIESIYISIANGGGPPQSGSTIFGTFTGTLDGDGFTISGLTLPLFDVIGMAPDGDEFETVEIQNLNLESGTGVNGVLGQGALANVLESGGDIVGVSFVGDVTGETQVGGLIGESSGGIALSYVTGNVTGTSVANGITDVGGLVGFQRDGVIILSYAIGTVTGFNYVGGLVGFSQGAQIINSYAASDVTGIDDSTTVDLEGINVGGLVGGGIANYIENSYATGAVNGNDSVGGLVGSSLEVTTIESYGTGAINGNGYEGLEEPEILSVVNFGFDPESEGLPFAINPSINDGLPYLVYLLNTYEVVEEDAEETPSFNLRSYYTQAAKSLDKALAHFGFKSNFSSHPNLGFKALEQNQSKLPATIQLFEVSEYQNCNILLNKEDGLQLSISSYYKEAVEIWTQGLNGEYLYLGLVEFDKDGKAILPTLKFDTANTYQLLMIKAADKLSQKPNLEAKVGQININVF